MPTYVDYIGLNTLISSSFGSTTNILSSSAARQPLLVDMIPSGQVLAGINAHRNGPYGFSSWKQIRASENPITRYHNKNSDFTFITQPGPIINIRPAGQEERVRNRYSSIYRFEEPHVTQKAKPLTWNMGKHVDGRSSPPKKFSVVSSYYNNLIRFSNDRVNSLLRYNIPEEDVEYNVIKDMYLDGGLNDEGSPITYWEFLRYNEVVYPRPENAFRKETRGRRNYFSFYKKARLDRCKNYHPHVWGKRTVTKNDLEEKPRLSIFEFLINEKGGPDKGTWSIWPMDAPLNFLTKPQYNEGANTMGVYTHKVMGRSKVDSNIHRIHYAPDEGNVGTRLPPNQSVFSNSSGMGILTRYPQFVKDARDYYYRTGIVDSVSHGDYGSMLSEIEDLDDWRQAGPLYARYNGLWQTGSVVAPSGLVIPSTGSAACTDQNIFRFEGGAIWEAWKVPNRKPFYDSYEDWASDIRLKNKSYTIIPEFRISKHVENIMKSGSAYYETDLFEMYGGETNNTASNHGDFYKTYSTSDFLKQFEILDKDHEDFTNSQILRLRCNAVLKLLPYDGFYPCQRAADLAGRFYKSYKDNMTYTTPHFPSGIPGLDAGFFGRQMVMTPLFAPGVLFNTIKSGIAVDYPILTGSNGLQTGATGTGAMIQNKNFHVRVPFEALLEPERYLAGMECISNEPHPSASQSGSTIWDGTGDDLYKMMANNFFAEIPEFFLNNGNMTAIVSRKQEQLGILNQGEVYGMRVRMYRSMNKNRNRAYHHDMADEAYYPPQDIIANSVRETFTMYSKPTAFGPPSRGRTDFDSGLYHNLEANKVGNYVDVGATYESSPLNKDSRSGYNFPFTPPYYHGEAWCDIVITGSGEQLTMAEIINACSMSYTRFDRSFYESRAGTVDILNQVGPQALARINHNAVQLSASLNLKGIGKTTQRSESQALVVDTGDENEKRWIIQAKFETPMLNFNHVTSGSEYLTLPTAPSGGYGSEQVPRGMWHQFGKIPEENEGVFLRVGPIDPTWQKLVSGRSETMRDLSTFLGFSGNPVKLGRIAGSKKLEEAVVAIPYLEIAHEKKFFELDDRSVKEYLDNPEESLLGASVKNQLRAMEKYIFPPTFDFLNDRSLNPIAMYIFEFSHTLTQKDLSYIWQGLMPDISVQHEEATATITHPLLLKELLGGGFSADNTTHRMHPELRWMVFKVKKRAANNYFKKVVTRNFAIDSATDYAGAIAVDEFGEITKAQYNWPYDYFSLVELASIDATVEFSNRDYTDFLEELPPINAQETDWPVVSFDDVLPHEILPDAEALPLAPGAGLGLGSTAPTIPGTDIEMELAPIGGGGFSFFGAVQEEEEAIIETHESHQQSGCDWVPDENKTDRQNMKACALAFMACDGGLITGGLRRAAESHVRNHDYFVYIPKMYQFNIKVKNGELEWYYPIDDGAWGTGAGNYPRVVD